MVNKQLRKECKMLSGSQNVNADNLKEVQKYKEQKRTTLMSSLGKSRRATFKSFFDVAKTSKIYNDLETGDIDDQKVDMMSEKFGNNFELFKCMEAETINFNFAKL